MTTSAIPAYGSLLKLGDGGSPEVFTTIAEVTEVKTPKIEAKEEDVTSHDSGGWEETIPTLLMGGEIPVKVNWLATDPTQNETTGVLGLILNRTKRNWKLVLPNATKTFSFKAWVKDFEGDLPVAGSQSANFTLKVTGPVTPA